MTLLFESRSSRPMCVDRLRFFLGIGILLFGICLVSSSRAQTATDDEELQESLSVVDQLREQREFREAISRLTTLREAHPENVQVLWRLAFTWADLGKASERQHQRKDAYKTALSHAEDALSADSASAWAHLAMAMAEGRVALNAGTQERIQRSRAVKHHAEQAIELDSSLAGAYHIRGRWHREVASLGFFQRALLKTVYGGLPDASYEQAVQDFTRAIELEDRPFHHLELGKTYLKMDRPEAARREFETVLDLPRSDPFDSEYKAEARQLLEELN